MHIDIDMSQDLSKYFSLTLTLHTGHLRSFFSQISQHCSQISWMHSVFLMSARCCRQIGHYFRVLAAGVDFLLRPNIIFYRLGSTFYSIA